MQNIPPVPDQTIRPMQVIVFALMSGVITFGAITMAITVGKPAGDTTMAFVAAAFGVGAILLSFVIPPIVGGVHAGQVFAKEGSTDPENIPNTVQQLAVSYQTKLIIGDAILEGAAFFNLVAYILAVQPISLIIAGVLVLLFPLRWGSTTGLHGDLRIGSSALRRTEETRDNETNHS
jgi:hypothetical protein